MYIFICTYHVYTHSEHRWFLILPEARLRAQGDPACPSHDPALLLLPFVLQQKPHLLHLQKDVSSGMWSWVAGAGSKWFLLPLRSPSCSKFRTSSNLKSACVIFPSRTLCTAREFTTYPKYRFFFLIPLDVFFRGLFLVD